MAALTASMQSEAQFVRGIDRKSELAGVAISILAVLLFAHFCDTASFLYQPMTTAADEPKSVVLMAMR